MHGSDERFDPVELLEYLRSRWIVFAASSHLQELCHRRRAFLPALERLPVRNSRTKALVDSLDPNVLKHYIAGHTVESGRSIEARSADDALRAAASAKVASARARLDVFEQQGKELIEGLAKGTAQLERWQGRGAALDNDEQSSRVPYDTVRVKRVCGLL